MRFYPIWKIFFILLITISSIIFTIPTFLFKTDTENWYLENKINLGLDLQGGSHLLLEVKNEVLLKEEMNNIAGFMRQFFRENKIKIKSFDINNEIISVNLLESSDSDKLTSFKNKNYPNLNLEKKKNIFSFTLSDAYKKSLLESSIKQSLEIVRKRIDETGTKEPLIQRQGIDRILLQLPGVKDPERIKNLLGKTAKLTFHMVDDKNVAALNNKNPPPGKMIVNDLVENELYYLVEIRSRVGGENLVDAQPTYEQNRPAVSFRFDPTGARKFGKATSNNVGNRFAIILDDKVITAPVIRSAITGGSGVISGNFTIQEAQDLLKMRENLINQALQEGRRIKSVAEEEAKTRLAENTILKEAEAMSQEILEKTKGQAQDILADTETQAIKQKEEAEVAGQTAVEAEAVITTHLLESLKKCCHRLLDRQETQKIIDTN